MMFSFNGKLTLYLCLISMCVSPYQCIVLTVGDVLGVGRAALTVLGKILFDPFGKQLSSDIASDVTSALTPKISLTRATDWDVGGFQGASGSGSLSGSIGLNVPYGMQAGQQRFGAVDYGQRGSWSSESGGNINSGFPPRTDISMTGAPGWNTGGLTQASGSGSLSGVPYGMQTNQQNTLAINYGAGGPGTSTSGMYSSGKLGFDVRSQYTGTPQNFAGIVKVPGSRQINIDLNPSLPQSSVSISNYADGSCAGCPGYRKKLIEDGKDY